MSNIDLFWKIMRVTDLPVTIATNGFYTTDYDIDPCVQHFIGDTPIEAAKWLAWDHLSSCIDFDCNCSDLTDDILGKCIQAGPDNQFDS